MPYMHTVLFNKAGGPSSFAYVLRPATFLHRLLFAQALLRTRNLGHGSLAMQPVPLGVRLWRRARMNNPRQAKGQASKRLRN